MSEQEIKEFEEKLNIGLRLAEERMLQEKALHDECVVVQTMDGTIQRIPAKEAISSLAM
jgi:hypothetical protein